MSPVAPLAGLADLVLRNPTLQQAMADAKGGLATLDLTGPAALRPFVVKGLVDAGRTVLVVAATVREAEDLTEELADLLDPSSVALFPAWETLPHERLSPRSDTVGRRLAVLRRLKHPGTEAGNGPLKVVVAPVRSVLQPQVKGLADLEPVELRPVRRSSSRTSSRGSPARRTPASTSSRSAASSPCAAASSTSSRRPRSTRCGSSSSATRSTRSARFAVADQRTLEPGRAAVGAAVPRAAAHRRRTAPGRRARAGPPAAARAHRQAGRGHRRRGHGVAGAGAGRRDGDARRAAAARQPRARARPRAGPHPRPRPGRDQRGVPRRQLGRGGRRRHGPDRPRRRVAARRSARCAPRCSTRARRGGGSARSGSDSDGRRRP